MSRIDISTVTHFLLRSSISHSINQLVMNYSVQATVSSLTFSYLRILSSEGGGEMFAMTLVFMLKVSPLSWSGEGREPLRTNRDNNTPVPGSRHQVVPV